MSTFTVCLEIDNATGEILKVTDKDKNEPEQHDNTNPHKSLYLICGVVTPHHKPTPGKRNTCPSGKTHIIIGNTHYCI